MWQSQSAQTLLISQALASEQGEFLCNALFLEMVYMEKSKTNALEQNLNEA